ncbi:MAG: 4-hydroxy-3-methylbut-2-enyl diphosphate reductase [Endomicrobiia bacterium]
MKIILSKCIGFCSGVNRCVKLTQNLLDKKNKVYALGQLLHNSQEMDRLKNLGLKIVDKISTIKKDANVIIRTHGIEKNVLDKLIKKKVNVIDGTCPIVKRNQKLAIEYSNKGYNIIIYGDINHPEIKALVSYTNPEVETFIINSIDEIDTITIYKGSGIVLIGQTTKELEQYKTIAKMLKKKFHNIKILDTICKETIIRENDTNNISKKVDIVIVVGGKNSANTKKLVNIALRNTKKVFHINDATELNVKKINKNDTIGIISGASTPIWLVENVVKKLQCL